MDQSRFFGLADDKIYYDERKKRFVHLENASLQQEMAYKNAHFKEVMRKRNEIAAKAWFVWGRADLLQDKVQARTAAAEANELPNEIGDEEALQNHAQ